jgi:23S rRNA (cytosine1962-C5)-methyltransferase
LGDDGQDREASDGRLSAAPAAEDEGRAPASAAGARNLYASAPYTSALCANAPYTSAAQAGAVSATALPASAANPPTAPHSGGLPSDALLSIKLNPKALRRAESGAIWFWPADLEDASALPPGPANLLLLEPRGKAVASALYDPSSPAPIRVYHSGRKEFSAELALARWRQAIGWRRKLIPADTNAFRVLHSEGDQTPGLIADRFGAHLSFALSCDQWCPHLPALLASVPEEWAISSASVDIRGASRALLGQAPESIAYRMNGFTLFARSEGGQKTGAFLDQRENYRRLLEWMNCLDSREFALDLYSSNGGFARHLAARTGRVEAVERGQSAIDLLKHGLSADGVDNVQATRSDVMTYLQGKVQARRTYDVVVVDPPAFAKHRRERDAGLRQYAAVNAKALRLVRTGGLFVSCSCSHHISPEDLLNVVREASHQNGKTLQILEKRAQSSDHPILLQAPETEYLKCFYFRVI